MTETALAVVENKLDRPEAGALALMGRAHDVAGVCREIVMRTAMELQGKRYVKVEGWQSIATAFGCSPSIRDVVEEAGGVKAVAELKRNDTGQVLATAEGYCGVDEPRWSNQAAYARRGMAQTRAISRVCRNVFAFVVVLIDEKLSTTPFEEVTSEDAVIRPTATPAAAPPANAPGLIRDKSTQCTFGRAKGQYFCDLDQENLDWQLTAHEKSVAANDPKWHESNVRRLAALQAEVARRGPVAPVAKPKPKTRPVQRSLVVDVHGEETEEQAARRQSEDAMSTEVPF